MKVWKNLFGKNDKIHSDVIAVGNSTLTEKINDINNDLNSLHGNSLSSTISFSDMMGGGSASGGVGNALDWLHSNISSQSTGIITLTRSTGWPWFAILGKHSNSDYGGILFTSRTSRLYIFRYHNGTFRLNY